MPLKSMDMMKIMEQFHKEEECREILVELRWPNGVTCPRCYEQRYGYDSKTFRYDCYGCGYGFTALAGTIFQDTKLPLRKWFMAVLLMTEAKKGISANQVKRTLGVSYKTAWYLCHRIRAAMAEVNQLSGTIEVDETYVGGKARGKGRGYRANKTIVAGATQRGGDVVLQVVDGNGRQTLHDFIRTSTDPRVRRIITDEWPAYRGIADDDTSHETVNHRQEEWVRGDIHTNTVEGVWGLFKRSITGSYHKLSAKHLNAYLDELEWRYNNRKNPYLFRDTLVKLLNSENLPYADLVH